MNVNNRSLNCTIFPIGYGSLKIQYGLRWWLDIEKVWQKIKIRILRLELHLHHLTVEADGTC